MKTNLTNIVGVYPEIVTKNCTSSTSKDGTALNKVLFDDEVGFRQACTQQGGIDPSENAETYLESDILNGIRNCCGAPGEIVYFPCFNLTQITDLGLRLLPLIGQAVSRTTYALLDRYVFCGDDLQATASCFYHCSILDGIPIRNASGGFLKLPDLQGRFIRSLNTLAQTANGLYNESIKEHTHKLTASNATGRVGKNNVNKGAGTEADRYTVELMSTTAQANDVIAKDSTIANGTETVPAHISIYACIRY